MTYKQTLEQYIKDIKDKKIATGIYTKKAIERFEKDIQRQTDAFFDFCYIQEKADILLTFAESLKPADLNGKAIKLLPWQVFCLSNLEGWRYKNDHNRKRFRTGYIEVNRKNGKTTGLLEPLTLFNFLKYPASESYLVSSRDDLAEKTFKEITSIIESDPHLKENCNCHSLAITFENSRIGFFCDGAKDTDGFKPRFFCLDEYHAFATDKILTSMMYGTRSKQDAQGVMITTADADINVPCYDQNLKSKRILNNLQTQEDFFCIIYAIDEEDDYKDPKVWQKANPSLYDIIAPDVIQADINDAELTPSRIPELKAKTFGIWGGGGRKSWLPLEVFQQNKNTKVNFEDFEKYPCVGAIDLSQVDDITAFTLCFEQDGKRYFKHRFYIPKEAAFQKYKRENVNFFAWIEQGYIVATPGVTVDYDFMINDILHDAEIYNIMAIGYDRWQSTKVIEGIETNRPNILLVEIEQSLKKLSPITQSYEKAIRDGRIVDNNPVQAWMINNAEIRPDANGNYKPMKPSKASTRRIDGVITSIMAHSLLDNPQIKPQYKPLSYDEVSALF